MQVDCFKRNWKTRVCTTNCPFKSECEREGLKLNKIKLQKEISNKRRG